MNAVWAKEIRGQKNHTVAFLYRMKATKNDTLKLAAASVYRFTVNGTLVGYGPARAAHGYSRVDEYSLSAYEGQEITLMFEVFAPNINTYYVVDELPFFAIEIYRDGKLIAEAKDFEAYLMNDRVVRSQRFSFQRAFVESYRMKKCRFGAIGEYSTLFPRVETEAVSMNKLLPRNVSYPTYLSYPYKEIVVDELNAEKKEP